MKLMKFFLAWIFCIVVSIVGLSSAEIGGVTLGIPENITALPDHEFSIFVELLNEDSVMKKVVVRVVSEGLSLDEETEVVLEGSKRIEFVIPSSNLKIGHYILGWTILVDDEVSTQSTKLQVSNAGKVVGELIDYYQGQLNFVEDKYEGEYLIDAEMHLGLAKELYLGGMYFESMKYLDMVRESLSFAIQEGNVKSDSRSMDFFGGLKDFYYWFFAVVIFTSVLVFVYRRKGGFKLFRKKYKEEEYSVNRKEEDLNCEKKRSGLSSDLEDKMSLLRRKINVLNDGLKKKELLRELKSCEDKYSVGLISLGDAYYRKIGEKLEG